MADLASLQQQAARLLLAVLEETLTPRQALARWPVLHEADDASVWAAYHALWHFEADEDVHKTEPYYCDLQLALLRHMAENLASGTAFPAHILAGYAGHPHVMPYDEGRHWQRALWQWPLDTLGNGGHVLKGMFGAAWRQARQILAVSK
jgi:hypothetical protein